jgi:hypothetical protein
VWPVKVREEMTMMNFTNHHYFAQIIHRGQFGR